MRDRHLVAALAALAVAVTPACSRSFDAYLANPCPHELRIEIHRRNPLDVAEGSALETVTVPAQDVELVEAAFGDDRNSISLPGGRMPLEVHEDDLPHETVVLPATYCEG